MIIFKKGNIFEEEAEAIVNTVNCVGVMGRGIALQFKKKYPENFKDYLNSCKQGELKPGRMLLHQNCSSDSVKYIINFPTKRHWKQKSDLEDIKSGLNDLYNVIQSLNIKSIALPPLGCGLGGLKWSSVKKLIIEALDRLPDINIIVFVPNENYSIDKPINEKVPKMTAGRAALIELIHRYMNGLLDPFVTLVEVHKLMYFLQEAGEPLKLKYTKHFYGPYAENLRHVFNKIEGHFISGYKDGGDNPNKVLTLIPGSYEKANKFLSTQENTYKRFKKVSDLVDGFETPYGLELLSTVYWVITNSSDIRSEDDVIEEIYNWNDRKKRFSRKQINLAIQILEEKDWVTPMSKAGYTNHPKI